MLTGTPLDLTPFGAVLQGIGLLYWLLFIAAFAFVIVKVKGRIAKPLAIMAVLATMLMPLVWSRIEQVKQKARLDTAMARYQMHCKDSGEKIYRTVENVDGLFLMKVRINKNDREPKQFKLDDPYGRDYDGEYFIEYFLHGPKEQEYLIGTFTAHPGYRYVEAIDPKDGLRYRYTGYVDEVWKRDSHHVKGDTRFVLNKAISTVPESRYGVTYDDISTREDRAFWIAGSSLRVIDLQTNEVIAERIGYMIDQGQGSQAGLRNPWFFAAYNACPAFPLIYPDQQYVTQAGQTRNFVEKVLKPRQQSGK